MASRRFDVAADLAAGHAPSLLPGGLWILAQWQEDAVPADLVERLGARFVEVPPSREKWSTRSVSARSSANAFG